jgi:hypothetical protein
MDLRENGAETGGLRQPTGEKEKAFERYLLFHFIKKSCIIDV